MAVNKNETEDCVTMAVDDKGSEDSVKLWIGEYLRDKNISEYKVSLENISEKGQGYLSDIIFVKASGLNERSEKQEFDFVVKVSKKNETLRKSFPLRESFDREIYVYNEVIPTFKLFMKEKQANFELDFIPKCYKTIFQDKTEGIILENLKMKGFQLHSNTKPLNLKHIKLVLLNMAKFHAVSFAFRDQNKDEFKKLTVNFNSLMSITVRGESMQTLFRTEMFTAIKYLKEIDESELAAQLQKRINDDPNVILKSIYNEDIEQSVILHGDTWINNYMFRYEEDDFTTPAAVAFLDWQISSLHSPALDVSQFLYAVSSEEALVTNFEDLMVFYHSKLSSCLRELGSNPENIFPYSLLIEHWKKYSVASLIFVVGFLKTIVSDGDEIPTTENIASGLGDVFSNVIITNMDAYRSRLVAMENDNENPTRLVILDWQVSIQHSPVIDLSLFLYSLGGEHINNLLELFEFYHSTLSRFLQELGTDVGKVYPFAAVLEDWRRYSFYGFAFLITFLEIPFIENKDAPNVYQMKGCLDRIGKSDEYRNIRLIQAVDQYCNHKL